MYNNLDFKNWTHTKKIVFNKSKSIKISLSNISIYEYPSKHEELRIVFFDQDYTSNLINNTSRKKQIWKVENKEWKIIYEGTE